MKDRFNKALKVIGLVVVIAFVTLVCFMLLIWFAVTDWIARHVYDFDAPFRDERGPFVLVLRSFADGMAIAEIEWTCLIDGEDVARPRMMGSDVLSDLLASCNSERFVGIANGRRHESLLLLNVPNENWFDAFRILADYAKAILVLPEASDGLLCEVESIAQEHANKVRILMPPSRSGTRQRTTDGTFVYAPEALERASLWQQACAAFDSVGVKLPPYNPSGAFLRLGPNGTVLPDVIPWGGQTLAELLREAGSHGDARLALRALRKARIPLVSIPADERRLTHRIEQMPTPQISSDAAVEGFDHLAPYQLEKRRRRAALEVIVQHLTGNVPETNTSSTAPSAKGD